MSEFTFKKYDSLQRLMKLKQNVLNFYNEIESVIRQPNEIGTLIINQKTNGIPDNILFSHSTRH